MGVRAGRTRWAFRTDLTLWTLRTFWACRSRRPRIALWAGDTLRSLRSDLASAYGVHADEAPPLTLEELAFPYVAQEIVRMERAAAEFAQWIVSCGMTPLRASQ
jgi:hypothetical protein